MKNWKQAALAFELNIPEADLETLAPALNAIEKAFRPLISKIPIETDPAVTFFAAPEDAE
ncbi:MAG TPA: hypothetical protein VKV15_03505 [Bryobacteraceae bacterium]|nr:hypothetical protein [Bryobacteraceae bacterium]